MDLPPIVTILVVLAIAIVGVLMATRNSEPMPEEKAVKFAGILRILVAIMLIGVVIRYFFMS